VTDKSKMLVRDSLLFLISSWIFLVFLLPESLNVVLIWTFSLWLCGIASGIVLLVFLNTPRTKCPKAITVLVFLTFICFWGSHVVVCFYGIDVRSFNIYPVWLKLLRWISFLIIVGFFLYRIYMDFKFSEKIGGA
jgi:hypothetical protein